METFLNKSSIFSNVSMYKYVYKYVYVVSMHKWEKRQKNMMILYMLD